MLFHGHWIVQISRKSFSKDYIRYLSLDLKSVRKLKRQLFELVMLQPFLVILSPYFRWFFLEKLKKTRTNATQNSYKKYKKFIDSKVATWSKTYPNLIHLFPDLHTFRFLEKPSLRKNSVGGTVIMFQLTRNSPTSVQKLTRVSLTGTFLEAFG